MFSFLCRLISAIFLRPGFVSWWSLTARLTCSWLSQWTDMTPSLIPWGSTGAVSGDTSLWKLFWYLTNFVFVPDNRAKWLVLSAWVTSILFSVPILFFFDLAETTGKVCLFRYLNIYIIKDKQILLKQLLFFFRIRHPMLDWLQLPVAVAGLHEPGVPLHLHHPRHHHRRVLHHHHCYHLEVRGAISLQDDRILHFSDAVGCLSLPLWPTPSCPEVSSCSY